MVFPREARSDQFLFLIYINDLPYCSRVCFLLEYSVADDTNVFASEHDLRNLEQPRENEGTERDIQGVGWDMSIPLKLFLVLGGNGSLFPQTSA